MSQQQQTLEKHSLGSRSSRWWFLFSTVRMWGFNSNVDFTYFLYTWQKYKNWAFCFVKPFNMKGVIMIGNFLKFSFNVHIFAANFEFLNSYTQTGVHLSTRVHLSNSFKINFVTFFLADHAWWPRSNKTTTSGFDFLREINLSQFPPLIYQMPIWRSFWLLHQPRPTNHGHQQPDCGDQL